MNTAAAICAVNWFKGGRGRIGFGRARCFFTTKRDNNSSLQYEWGTGYTNANLKSCFPATRISILHRSVIASLSPNWIQTKYFYTVRMGRIPGIHDNWEDCKSQVQGFHGDEYKKFSSRIEAKEYVAAHEVNGTRCMIKNAFVKDLERGQDAYKNQVEEPLAKATKSKRTKKNDETESNEAQDLVKASSQLEEPLPKAIKSKRTRKKLDETESNEARKLLTASSPLNKLLGNSTKSTRSRKEVDAADSNEAFYMLEFDGACKENPGKAGAGALLRSQDGKVVYELREGVGFATNNVAEYRAVILGLKVALSKGISRIHVRGDSKLVCKQIQGLWKTKNENMAKLCAEAKELKAKFKEFHIKHIYREFNSDADALANAAVNLQNGEWLASKVALQDSSDASSLVEPLEISAKSRSLKKIGVTDCDKDLFQVSEKSLEKISKSRKARKKLDATDSNEDLIQVADKPLEKISKSKKARKKLDATGSEEDLFQVSEKPIEMITKSRKSRKKLVATDSDEAFYTLEFDGACKENPGKAGAGALLRSQDGKVVYELREGVGIATNNVAEYRAVILGLKVALSKGISRIRVRGDSKLVCKQIQGLWKTKNENMAKLCAEAKELKAKFKEFHIKHIYREFNSDADALANAAVNLQNGEWLASKVGLQDSSDASSLVQPLEISAKSRSLKKIGGTDCDKDLFQVSEKSLEKISKSRKARKKLDAKDSNEDLFQVADKPLEKISKSKKARKKLDATGSEEDLFQVSEKAIEMITKSRKSRKKLVATDSKEEFNSDADALANAAIKLQNGKCLSSRVDANGHTA